MIADPVPDQSQGRVAHSSGHTPHLTIHALGDLQLQPTVRHGLAHPDGGITLPHRGLGDASDLGRPRHPPLHHDPATKPRKGRIIGEPLDLNPVGLGFAELGMGELMLQLTVIGEQQEPFAIGIESTAGINARSFDEVRQGGALPVTRKLAENSVGLVECDQQRFSSCRRGQAGSPERMTPALPWPHPILLAPLTKGGNLPYRRLCVDFGAKVTCSEMAYSHKLLKGSGRELALLRHHESETFFGVQIATHKPELAAESAVLAVEHGAKWVDLNCGCPIDDTVKRGMGARLMDRPKVLVESVAAMVRAAAAPRPLKAIFSKKIESQPPDITFFLLIGGNFQVFEKLLSNRLKLGISRFKIEVLFVLLSFTSGSGSTGLKFLVIKLSTEERKYLKK